MQTMYPGKVNSPKALTEDIIGASETTIEVSDGSVLPAAPNLAVLGSGETCETILYTVKTGNILSGITRGFQGTAQEWPAETPIARSFTEYDHAAFTANIAELAADVGSLDGRIDTAEDAIDALEDSAATLGTDKLDKTGDGSNVTAAFTAAGTRANIATGESLATLFGKLAKWFADFGAAAWLNVGSGASEVAVGNHLHGSIANDGKIGATANLPVFTGAGGTVETKTVAEARNTLGLGNTTGALPVANGGTGAVDAATARTNLGVQATMTPGTDYIPPSGGTMTGALIAKDSTDYTTAQVRNIVASTTDLTAGTSSLASGQVYLVYE